MLCMNRYFSKVQSYLKFRKTLLYKCFNMFITLVFNNKKLLSLSSFFSYKHLNLKLRVFSAVHCFYGNQLCYKIDSHLLTNDWAVF